MSINWYLLISIQSCHRFCFQATLAFLTLAAPSTPYWTKNKTSATENNCNKQLNKIENPIVKMRTLTERYIFSTTMKMGTYAKKRKWSYFLGFYLSFSIMERRTAWVQLNYLPITTYNVNNMQTIIVYILRNNLNDWKNELIIQCSL